MPMAEISETAHERAKQDDRVIKDVVDDWANSHNVLGALGLRVVSMMTLTGDEEPDDVRSTRPNKPDVLELHKPTLSKRGTIVPDCGLPDPDAVPVPTSSIDDLPGRFGAPAAEVDDCEHCYPDE